MRLSLAERVKNLQESATMAFDQKAREMQNCGEKVFKWTAGEPDFLPERSILNSMVAGLWEGKTKYTDAQGILELRKEIAHYFVKSLNLHYKEEEIIVTNGAKEAIFIALMAMINSGDEVVIIPPYWTSYPEMVKLCGGVPCFYQSNNFKKFGCFLDSVSPKAIILNSPNNPTGHIFSAEDMYYLAEALSKHNLWILSDEIYHALVYQDYKHISITTLGSELKAKTVVIDGVSKSAAMQGLRIGWAAGPREVIAAMTKLKSQLSGCSSSIGQIGAVTALKEEKNLKKMQQAYEKRWQKIVRPFAQKMGLKYIEPQAAFYFFFQIPKYFAGKCEKFRDKLLEEAKIAIIAGKDFGWPGWARLCFASHESELIEGLNLFEKFLLKYT